jgi:hypothetical protein
MRFLQFSMLGLSIFVSAMQVGRAQQQSIGSVGVQDATVAGALEVSGGRALLVGNTTVTARDKTAEVELKRGGVLRVCATTGLHVTAGTAADNTGILVPLMLAIDRGAIEVQMPATTRDVVTTPDLRFTMRVDGPLDLQLRVTRNGDTCVENRGEKAPVLNVADQFGEATYELKAGQHVLFEHGSLKEVVDHESSACGCPPEPTMSVADALVNANGSGAKTAAEAHPFPAAVSAGLAPATVPQSSAGSVHTQVTATLNAGGGGDTLAVTKASTDAAAETAKNAAAGQTPPAPAKSSNNPFRAVGRFFKKIFGGE